APARHLQGQGTSRLEARDRSRRRNRAHRRVLPRRPLAPHSSTRGFGGRLRVVFRPAPPVARETDGMGGSEQTKTSDRVEHRLEVERWFLQRGIPHFIHGYRATEDVFTRALPVLLLVILL